MIPSEFKNAVKEAMAYLRMRLSDAELSRYEAAAEETPPRIYQLPQLNSIVLEMLHVVARPYEIKTKEEGVDE